MLTARLRFGRLAGYNPVLTPLVRPRTASTSSGGREQQVNGQQVLADDDAFTRYAGQRTLIFGSAQVQVAFLPQAAVCYSSANLTRLS